MLLGLGIIQLQQVLQVSQSKPKQVLKISSILMSLKVATSTEPHGVSGATVAKPPSDGADQEVMAEVLKGKTGRHYL